MRYRHSVANIQSTFTQPGIPHQQQLQYSEQLKHVNPNQIRSRPKPIVDVSPDASAQPNILPKQKINQQTPTQQSTPMINEKSMILLEEEAKETEKNSREETKISDTIQEEMAVDCDGILPESEELSTLLIPEICVHSRENSEGTDFEKIDQNEEEEEEQEQEDVHEEEEDDYPEDLEEPQQYMLPGMEEASSTTTDEASTISGDEPVVSIIYGEKSLKVLFI